MENKPYWKGNGRIETNAERGVEDDRAATAEPRALMEELRRTMQLYERGDAS